ncbi:MAG TPA: sugar ABC transporter permease [Roseiflexaceae bacterium]|jgi:multiple sugar transport system permease protein|nr:sugar ABC transporter permease [Roseiflexaceae bacterium]
MAPSANVAPQRSQRAASLARRETLTAYLFIAPYLITAGIFTFGVLAYVFYTSFTNLTASFAIANVRFIGFANYVRAFKDPNFRIALVNVFWYFVVVTTLQTIGAILLATLLNVKLKGMRFFRTMLYAPSVASAVVISLIFLWLYLRTGFINYVLGTNIAWLQDPRRILDFIYTPLGLTNVPVFFRGPSVAWVAIMMLNIFTTVPTFMVMVLAALQDIPGHLYEAASLDGAGNVRSFWSITLPLLRPVIALIVILGTIGTFLVFAQIAIMTQGGPLNTTLVPLYLIYQKTLGTGTSAEAGFGAAMSFILAAIIIVITLIQRRYIERSAQ